MTTADFDAEGLEALARLELLQGTLPLEQANLSQRYEAYGAADDPWTAKAAVAYRAMHDHGGWVASVGDELAVELDIRENAELYAAVGGFDVSEITQGLGVWWSPSATWFQLGRTLLAPQIQLGPPEFEQPRSSELEAFNALSQTLLEAGAQVLTTFFTTIATSGARLVEATGRSGRRRGHQREFAFVAEFARQRALLFRDGPDSNGRYLAWREVSERQLSEVLESARAASEAWAEA